MAQITLLTNGDITHSAWQDNGVYSTHWESINDDVSGSPTDTDYIDTTTIDGVAEVEMEDSPANLSQCTAIEVSVRGSVVDAAVSALIEVGILHTVSTHIGASPYDVTGTNFGGYGTLGNYVIPEITGLTLSKTEIDSLRIRFTFRAS